MKAKHARTLRVGDLVQCYFSNSLRVAEIVSIDWPLFVVKTTAKNGGRVIETQRRYTALEFAPPGATVDWFQPPPATAATEWRVAEMTSRDRGTLRHAVPLAGGDFAAAACGGRPGQRGNGWKAASGGDITCELCKRRLLRLGELPRQGVQDGKRQTPMDGR